MPKKAPTPFEVDGVQCTVKDRLVNVGLNAGWPVSLRFPMKVKPTDDIAACTEKVRKHAKFAACNAQLAGLEVAGSSSEPQGPQEPSRTVLFNGSSLQRETAALRQDLDRKATALPLAIQQPGADFIVLRGYAPPRLAHAYPWSHLEGVWARRAELVNGRPAYTFAYSWVSRETLEVLMPDDRSVQIALWYSPLATRVGHDAGEALSGWIIGEMGRLGKGYTTGGPADFLINTDPAPIPELIRTERRTWSSCRERGRKISGSGWLAMVRGDGGRLIDVQISFKPMEVPQACFFQRAFRDPEDGELCLLSDEFYERPVGPQPRRLFEYRCSHRRPRKRCSRGASSMYGESTDFLVRCDEVTSALYWRRRSCVACGASGPVDGSSLERPDDVELEPCAKGCGAFFCVQPGFDIWCTQPTGRHCPHLQCTNVPPHMSNTNIATMTLQCSCDCCLRRMRKLHPCDVCEKLPCACQGHSGWKAMYGTLHDRIIAGESFV